MKLQNHQNRKNIEETVEDDKVEYSEKYGKDVDEAVRLALDELGLNEDQVMVTVLEEPSKGFLGLREKYAKVRVERIEEIVEDNLSQTEALAADGKPSTRAKHDFRKKSKPQNQQAQKSGQGHQDRQDGKDGTGRQNADRIPKTGQCNGCGMVDGYGHCHFLP